MVTDLGGHITQNMVYIPCGEVFVEERNGSWASPYLFNAKELDEETGLYYYGARYLDPAGARWLSVDPMWEDYSFMTPYNYCAGNPVKLIESDGNLFRNFLPQTYQNIKVKSDDYLKYTIEYISDTEGRTPETDYVTAERTATFKGYRKDDAAHFSFHGTEDGEITYNGELILLPSFITNQLSEESYSKVVLHACYAGKDELSYGARLSAKNPDIYVIAPNKEISWSIRTYTDCEFADAKDWVKNEGEFDNCGMWNVFKNGKIICSFDGDVIPTSEYIDYYLKENGNEE